MIRVTNNKGGLMKVGDLVKAKSKGNALRLSLPRSFGIITRVHAPQRNIVYIQWLDNIHNGERPIHICYLEVISESG
tara:strand:+ start:8204 stop:8434 length:231 start_codon:yes stop_codon:yes gene_type:complete